MAYEQKPNSGSIFKNDRKEGPQHPDSTGQGVIECPHCGASWATWISGWRKQGKNGGKAFLSLSFRSKDQQQPQQQPQQGRGAPPPSQQQRPQQNNNNNSYAQQKGGGGNNWQRDIEDEVPF